MWTHQPTALANHGQPPSLSLDFPVDLSISTQLDIDPRARLTLPNITSGDTSKDLKCFLALSRQLWLINMVLQSLPPSTRRTHPSMNQVGHASLQLPASCNLGPPQRRCGQVAGLPGISVFSPRPGWQPPRRTSRRRTDILGGTDGLGEVGQASTVLRHKFVWRELVAMLDSNQPHGSEAIVPEKAVTGPTSPLITPTSPRHAGPVELGAMGWRLGDSML